MRRGRGQPVGDDLSGLKMADRLAGRDRFGLHRLKPQHVDAVPCVQIIDLHRQQRADPFRIGRGPGQPDADPLHRVIGAEGLKPDLPHPAPGLVHRVTQPGQQTVQPGQHILGQANGVGQRHAHRIGSRLGHGRHRFGHLPQGLVDPQHHPGTKAARQRRARLVQQLGHPAHPQSRQLCHHVRIQPQRGQRQRAQDFAQLTPGGDAPRLDPGLGAGGCRQRRGRPAAFPVPPLGGARPGRPRLLIHGIAAAVMAHAAPGKARQRPGPAKRIRHPGLHA